MSEKEIYKKVILYGLLSSVAISLVSWLFLKDIRIPLGIMSGSVARMIGFLMIIQSSNTVLNSGKSYLSVVSYVGRLVFYGLVTYFALQYDLNVFSLLVGFSIINVVVYLLQLTMNKKGV